MKVGDKVHYTPFKGCNPKHIENGIVSDIPRHTDDSVRVVYHCAGDWEHYQKYTSQLTPILQLTPGWKEDL